jgi:hypothetical protein
MRKLSIYLVQFIATLMIVLGGIAVAGDMVAGEHNVWGWLAVILGTLFLIVGARQALKA